jgi:hypothetical protein
LPKKKKARAARDVVSLACLGVYDGSVCIGYLLPRNEQGVEAYGADDASLGLYPDQKAAADAVSAAVKGGGRVRSLRTQTAHGFCIWPISARCEAVAWCREQGECKK